ncbi:MAG: RNA methyltransferase [Candidatus Kapaibacterium sp.]
MQLSHNLHKYIRSLHDNHTRDEEECFTVEGEKLCRELLTSTLSVESVVVRTPIPTPLLNLATEFSNRRIPVFTTDERSFRQISDTQTPQGILAVARYPAAPTVPPERLIILDGIADPGNVGTIIRTAEWFGFHSILLCGASAHRYHPKTVRATMGSVFRTSILQPDNAIAYLRDHLTDYTFYGASLAASTPLHEVRPPQQRFALVFGSESHGISPAIQALLTGEYIIPAIGAAESLNVAVAAGISLYHFAKYTA